jgi:cytochrome c peroxidase
VRGLLLAGLVACSSGEWDHRAFPIPDHFPDPIVPADNPVTAAKVELGRHLFHDFRLSVNGKRSCGICHEAKKGWTDGFVRSVGATGHVAPRNSLSLGNVMWREALTWSNVHAGGLESQIDIPWRGTDPVEMGMDGQEALLVERVDAAGLYGELWQAAMGDAPVTFASAGQAIAAYQRTIIGGDSAYDAYLAGADDALTAAQERGRALFFGERMGCGQCHGGVFLDQPTTPEAGAPARHGYANVGLYNIDGEGGYPPGSEGLMEHTGEPSDEGVFRVPSLRNVSHTGPWVHDGTVLDLGDLLDAYARGGRNVQSGQYPGDGALNPHRSPLLAGFAMSAEDRADVLAFFEALTEPSLLVPGERLRNPFCEEDAEGNYTHEPCLPRFELQ